ncbi:MAG: TonB-dependent receptor [Bacteroidetes bacterium]|nr:TonB-dependent receptor [Bacteroidota bacterium]
MKLFITNLFLLITFSIFGQNAKLVGVVINAETKEPIIGAVISTNDGTIGTTSDVDGKYELELEAGTYKITFFADEFGLKTQEITIAANETKTLDFELEEVNILLNETVVTGSKYEKPLGQETVSMDVIKPVNIEKQNQNNLSTAISRSPGVTVIDGQVNIRGGSGYSYGAGSRVLLLSDGMPIVQSDAGFPNWGSIPVENIGQIEIIKGAASALYGSAAMNGIINIRTAYPTSKPVTKISFFTTQFGQPKKEKDEVTGEEIENAWWETDSFVINGQKIDLNENKRPYEAGFSVAHRQKFGKYDMVLGSMGISSQDFKYGGFNKFIRFNMLNRFRINEKNSIGINYNLQMGESGTFFLWKGAVGRDKFLPGDITGLPTVTKSYRILVDPYWNYSDSKGNSHKLLGRYYKITNDNTNNQGNFSDYAYGEYQYQKRIEKTGTSISTGIVGTYTNVRAELYGDETLTGKTFAVFAQLDQTLFEKLNLSGGFRYEGNKISKTKFEAKPVFRLGANYQATKYTYIRASFGQGYRFPTIAEKFIQTKLSDAFSILPNLDLISETGYSAEIGVKQGLKLGKVNCLFDIAGFYTQYKNMMEFNPFLTDDGGFGFQSQNVGNTRIMGVETSIAGEGKVGKTNHTFLIGYTYISPKFVDWEGDNQDGSVTEYNVLKYRFRHTMTGNYDFTYKRLDLGLTMQYYSFMENVDNIFAIAINGLSDWRDSKLKDNYESKKPQKQHKGDLIMDARVGLRFSQDHGKISFLVKNLTNKLYSIRPAMMEAPINYSVRLDFTF